MSQPVKHSDCDHTITTYRDSLTLDHVYECPKCHTKIEIPYHTLSDSSEKVTENVKNMLIMAFGRIPTE